METCSNRGFQPNGNHRTCINSSPNISVKPKDTLWDEDFPIGMCYVPWQQWGDLYSGEQALKEGTIFKDLNKVFCGVRC